MRSISQGEYKRFVTALSHLRHQLIYRSHEELAHEIACLETEMVNIYREYIDCLASLEEITERYHKTFKETHEVYTKISRARKKAYTREKKVSQ